MTPAHTTRLRVLVLVHAVRTPEEREVHALLLGRLRARGAAITTIAWDRGMAFLDLEAFGPVHEIEEINRWPLPQHLGRWGLRPVARLLRQRRVRSWWGREGPPDAVLVLGRLRDEMRHYLPPGSGPVTAVLGWRPPEGAESTAATLALADDVVAADADVAAEVHAAGTPVRTIAEVVEALTPSPADPPDELLVCGVGPGDWRGAADLFLRMAAGLPDEVDGRPVRFAWLGLDPADGRSYPYLHDADHLGLADRIDWWHRPVEALAALGAASVVVVTGRTPFAPPVHPFVDAAGLPNLLRAQGTPVVGFATPAVEGLDATPVEYPDVTALGEAVLSRLADARTGDLDAVVDTVLPDPVR
jgi:hypothetical protein